MKKKIGIITFQESHNFGALLQAYALQHTLQLRGYSAEIINYHSLYKETLYRSGTGKHSSLQARINNILSWNFRKKRRHNVDAFRKRYLNLSGEPLCSTEDLRVLSAQYDYVICGSDQVWNINSIGYDPTYFLDFVEEGKKVAYAPSMGIEHIPEDAVAFYTKQLSDFTNVSVREQAGANALEALLGRKIPVVLDPCLLLTCDQWDTIAEKISINEPYIFVYYIKYSKALINYAKKLSKKTGLKVVFSARTVRDLKNGFKNCDMGVPQFVGAIKNAEYVLTNSFHGTVFSILYQKKFITFLDERNEKNTSSRMRDLLNLIGLQNKMYLPDKADQLSVEKNESAVDLLNNQREKSLEFLFNCLK